MTWAAVSLAFVLATGCVAWRAPKADKSDACQAQVTGLRQQERLTDQLRQRLGQLQDQGESQKSEIGRLQIALLEKEALIGQLQDKAALQQQTLDEAVLEVVRTKAKLRSIESRAEAASTMAETEIALKTLKEQVLSPNAAAVGAREKAESLLKMSTVEFQRENYGGALYLAGQARAQITDIQSGRHHGPAAKMLSGERNFEPPLPLILLKRSNLRKAPDLTSDVLRVLEKDTRIVGYSHRDEWIRVGTEAGESGWIHRSLIGGR